MLALPGIFGLLVFIYVRPQEFEPSFKDLPVLYLFLGLAIIGVIIDVAMAKTRFIPSPGLPWALATTAWCLFTLAYRKFDSLQALGVNIAVSCTLFVVIAHGVQRFKSLLNVIVVIFCCGLFVAVVCADQGVSPTGCVMVNLADRERNGVVDGRPCNARMLEDGTFDDGTEECRKGGWSGLSYMCERIGWLGTKSIMMRVRYLGVLQDPNELALATGLIIPFAFLFYDLKQTRFRQLLLVFTVVAVGLEIVFTKSRGGQIVFGAVLAAYFVKKFGYKRGALVGIVMSIPLVVLGGRGGEEAHQSSIERLECAAAALEMLLVNPIMGVGHQQFTEYHGLTAHNAYLLAVAELGYVGLFLFSSLLFLSTKIPILVLRHYEDRPEARLETSTAMALLAAFSGIVVGIFFLSWTYHYVLWIYFGLSAALYASTKAAYPAFRVRYRPIEMGAVVAFCIGLTVLFTIYLSAKGILGGG